LEIAAMDTFHQFFPTFFRDLLLIDPRTALIAFLVFYFCNRIFDLVSFILVLREAQRGNYKQVQYKKWTLLKK
jgi:hypothetical protein